MNEEKEAESSYQQLQQAGIHSPSVDHTRFQEINLPLATLLLEIQGQLCEHKGGECVGHTGRLHECEAWSLFLSFTERLSHERELSSNCLTCRI